MLMYDYLLLYNTECFHLSFKIKHFIFVLRNLLFCVLPVTSLVLAEQYTGSEQVSYANIKIQYDKRNRQCKKCCSIFNGKLFACNWT